MSGRAGRRGLDDVGHVFLYFPPDEPLPWERDVRNVLTGPVLTLKSAFRLTYNMILNILRVDELRVEDMMQRSFSEAAGKMQVESMNELVARGDEQMLLVDEWIGDGMTDERELRRLSAMLVRLAELTRDLLPKLVLSPQSFAEAFTNGRVVIVQFPHHMLSLAVLLIPSAGLCKPRTKDRVRAVCLIGPTDAKASCGGLSDSILVRPGRPDANKSEQVQQFQADGWQFEVREIVVGDVVWFCKAAVANLPKIGRAGGGPLTRSAPSPQAVQVASSFLARFVHSAVLPPQGGSPDGESSLAPIQPLARIAGSHGAEEILARWEERDALVAEFARPSPGARSLAHALWSLSANCKARAKIMDVYTRREKLRAQIQGMRATASARRIPDLLPEYRKRVKVLQDMQYVGDDGVSVLIKGRYGACEVATVDSVLLTEIVLENVLEGLTPAEVASLLSALVCRKKNQAGDPAGDGDASVYSEGYRSAKAAMRKIVRNFGAVQQEAGVELEFEIGDASADYEGAMCRWALCEVVLRWAMGAPFAEVVTMTDLQEGDVVVTVKRLVELLKDAKGVAKAVGNEELEASIDDAVEAVRRDIIFSGSLYLT
jgi:antiviral helicase SKI2